MICALTEANDDGFALGLRLAVAPGGRSHFAALCRSIGSFIHQSATSWAILSPRIGLPPLSCT
jgi:hypothetical protein